MCMHYFHIERFGYKVAIPHFRKDPHTRSYVNLFPWVKFGVIMDYKYLLYSIYQEVHLIFFENVNKFLFSRVSNVRVHVLPSYPKIMIEFSPSRPQNVMPLWLCSLRCKLSSLLHPRNNDSHLILLLLWVECFLSWIDWTSFASNHPFGLTYLYLLQFFQFNLCILMFLLRYIYNWCL